MEKVRPWCGQPSDRGRLKNRNRPSVCEKNHQFWSSTKKMHRERNSVPFFLRHRVLIGQWPLQACFTSHRINPVNKTTALQ